MRSIERQLVTSEWLAERCCKVVFTDSAEPALSDLAAENVVLAARGYGWAPSTGGAAALELDDFLGRLRATGRAPRLVLVCFKYGARDAAKKLAAAGVAIVVWVAADVHDLIERELFEVSILPSLAILQTDVTETTLREARETLPIGCGDIIVDLSSATSASTSTFPVTPQPREWLVNTAPEPMLPTVAADLDLSTCDVEKLLELKKRLTAAAAAAGEARNSVCVVVRGGGGGNDDDTRARALACEASCSYARADRFRVVCRVASDDDARAARKTLAARTRARDALVWFDMPRDGRLDAATAVEWIETLASEFTTPHFVVTSCHDDGLDSVVARAGPHAETHEIVLAPELAPTKMSCMHEEIKLFVDEDDKRVDIAERQLTMCLIEALKTAALFDDAPPLLQAGEIAGLYLGNDNAVFVRVAIADVARLHALRDTVLSGDFSKALTRGLVDRAPHGDRSYVVHVDRSAFAERFESALLRLDKLTTHQEERLGEAMKASARGDDIHICGPAGSGKTFVGLHLLLEAVQSDAALTVLVVAKNQSLLLSTVNWLCMRLGEDTRAAVLRRTFMLHTPFDVPRAVRVSKSKLVTLPSDVTSFGLVVADEAHHLFKDHHARVALERFSRGARRVYLSNCSQSDGEATLVPGATTVVLSEIVRSTQRIVEAGRIFEFSGDEGGATAAAAASPHNETVGPPLLSFLFDAREDSESGADDRFKQYAERVREALNHLTADYPGLRLHNRLAMVVPDAAFLKRLKPALTAALPAHFALVDAAHASSFLFSGERVDGKQWLVCDTMENLDGLERLIVFAVGLDAPVDDGREHATRSLLYRAITRAHMLAGVINERVPRGWLEWLTRVELDEAAFSRVQEIERTNGGGAERLLRLRDAHAKTQEAERALEAGPPFDVGGFCTAFCAARDALAATAARDTPNGTALGERLRALETRGAALATEALVSARAAGATEIGADAASSAKQIEGARAAAMLFLSETIDESEIARLSRTAAQLVAASVDEASSVAAICDAFARLRAVSDDDYDDAADPLIGVGADAAAILEDTAARLGFDATRLAKLRALFEYYDVDKSGTLEANEVECMIAELGLDSDHSSARALLDEFGDVACGDDVVNGRAISFGSFLRHVAKRERETNSELRREHVPLLRRFSLSAVHAIGRLARSTGAADDGAVARTTNEGSAAASFDAADTAPPPQSTAATAADDALARHLREIASWDKDLLAAMCEIGEGKVRQLVLLPTVADGDDDASFREEEAATTQVHAAAAAPVDVIAVNEPNEATNEALTPPPLPSASDEPGDDAVVLRAATRRLRALAASRARSLLNECDGADESSDADALAAAARRLGDAHQLATMFALRNVDASAADRRRTRCALVATAKAAVADATRETARDAVRAATAPGARAAIAGRADAAIELARAVKIDGLPEVARLRAQAVFPRSIDVAARLADADTALDADATLQARCTTIRSARDALKAFGALGSGDDSEDAADADSADAPEGMMTLSRGDGGPPRWVVDSGLVERVRAKKDSLSATVEVSGRDAVAACVKREVDAMSSDDGALRTACEAAEDARAACAAFPSVASDRDRAEVTRRADEWARLADARAALEAARKALAALDGEGGDDGARAAAARDAIAVGDLAVKLARAAHVDSTNAACEVKRLVCAANEQLGDAARATDGATQGLFDVSHNTTAREEGELAFMPIQSSRSEAAAAAAAGGLLARRRRRHWAARGAAERAH